MTQDLVSSLHQSKVWWSSFSSQIHFQSGDDWSRTFWLINSQSSVHLLGKSSSKSKSSSLLLRLKKTTVWSFMDLLDAEIKQKLTLKWRQEDFWWWTCTRVSIDNILLLRISILFQWHEIPWMDSLLVKILFDVRFDWITEGTWPGKLVLLHPAGTTPHSLFGEAPFNSSLLQIGLFQPL